MKEIYFIILIIAQIFLINSVDQDGKNYKFDDIVYGRHTYQYYKYYSNYTTYYLKGEMDRTYYTNINANINYDGNNIDVSYYFTDYPLTEEQIISGQYKFDKAILNRKISDNIVVYNFQTKNEMPSKYCFLAIKIGDIIDDYVTFGIQSVMNSSLMFKSFWKGGFFSLLMLLLILS